MKVLILVVLIASIYSRELTGTQYSTNSQCDTCISDSNTYWWASTASSSSGYCCNISETKDYCLSGLNASDYICSNEGLSGRSQYLLCPQSGNNCSDSGDFVVSSGGLNNRVDTGIVPPGTTCENRIFLNTAASNETSYTLTVIVDYVLQDTRLGVYQYDTSSNSYTLVSEVSTNYWEHYSRCRK